MGTYNQIIPDVVTRVVFESNTKAYEYKGNVLVTTIYHGQVGYASIYVKNKGWHTDDGVTFYRPANCAN
jgi:hypothetical protein